MKKLTLLFLLFSVSRIAFAQEIPSVTQKKPKTRVIKMDFLAPLTGNLTFGYEQAITNSISFDSYLGLIGLGVSSNTRQPAGIFIKAGVKFCTSPDYVMEGMKKYNNMQGAYIRPEIIYSGFTSTISETYYDPITSKAIDMRVKYANNSFAFMLNLGAQKVIANTVTFDTYVGVGYGSSSIQQLTKVPDNLTQHQFFDRSDDTRFINKFSHIQLPKQFPIAFAAGITLGILLR